MFRRRARERDERHLEFIRSLPCCICGNPVSTEAAHLRASNLDYGKPPTGMAEKPSDQWALPLCSQHHREQHTRNEIAWWSNYGKDPFALCAKLWIVTGDHSMAEMIIERQLA